MISNGKVAKITKVSLQFNMNVMTNDVTINPRLCRRVAEQSMTIDRRMLASVSNRLANIVLACFVSSNHPISFCKITEEMHVSLKTMSCLKILMKIQSYEDIYNELFYLEKSSL